MSPRPDATLFFPADLRDSDASWRNLDELAAAAMRRELAAPPPSRPAKPPRKASALPDLGAFQKVR